LWPVVVTTAPRPPEGGLRNAGADRRRRFAAHRFCTGFSHLRRYCDRVSPAEVVAMDAAYLLILAGLYFVTHGLVWALGRLGTSP
jgi:hypothetical protein